MSSVIKIFKTVRNHWKKSVAFTLIAAYGVKYANDRLAEDTLRRQYCSEALAYGEQTADIYQKTRKITVFLNPAAYDGKGRSLFEKNAAPLLHLAGLEVTVVKTEYDGQIKEFMKYLESKHVDGIVVAGGNGSVLETITALMRKDDQSFRKKTPIGIIPVGTTNKFASFFFGSEKKDVKKMLDAAMAVVRGFHERVDVLQIQAEDGRSSYALCGMEAGAYRDAKEKTKKYWYFGPLKHRFTYMRPTLSSWPPRITGSLEYVPATETPSKPRPQVQTVEEKPVQAWTWTGLLYSFLKPPNKKKVVKPVDEEEDDPIDDSEVVTKDLSTVELTVNSRYTLPKEQKTLQGIEVGLGPEDVSRTDFISEGWRRLNSKPWEFGTETNEKLLVRKVKFTPQVKEGSSLWFTIDGEDFEAMPIEITLLKNRLRLFYNPMENLQPR